jgi:hypothetical protein
MAWQELFPTPMARIGGGRAAWLVLLIAMALLSSFTFACVTPFAAFAVLTAATLPLPRALAIMVAVWLVNQALGFLALGYPLDPSTFAWGGVIGIAALAATVAAARIGVRSWQHLVAGFAAAFLVYEALLYLAAFYLGGSENFSAGIVAKLALSDTCWLVGIAILRHGLMRFGANRLAGRRPVTT